MLAARVTVAVTRRVATAVLSRGAVVPCVRTHARAHVAATPTASMHMSSGAAAATRCADASRMVPRLWTPVRWQSQEASGDSADARADTHTPTPAAGATAAPGAAPAPADDAVKALQADITKLKAQVSELAATRLRLLAEMENVRTIAKRDVDNAKVYSIQSFAKRLVDSVDNLHFAVDSVPKDYHSKETARAVDSAGAPEVLHTLYIGVAATERSLLKTLSDFGVEQYGKAREKFDPNLHEAMLQVPATEDVEAGTVATILKTGFKIKDRVLRHAQVAVAIKQ